MAPIHWLLGGPLGELNKTNKASAIHKLYTVPSDNATVIDGMPVLINANVKRKTYGQLQTIPLRQQNVVAWRSSH